MEKIIFDGIEFVEISKHPNYFASKCGKIFSSSSGKIKNQRFINSGYMVVDIYHKGKGKTVTVHSLIAHTFIGERPFGLQVNHIDYNKLNNCDSNLEYMSRSQNIIHSVPNRKTYEVSKYDISGKFLDSYISLKEASLVNKIPMSQIIRTFNDLSATVRNSFFFSKIKKEKLPSRNIGKNTSVIMCDMQGIEIKRFISIKQACEEIGAHSSGIVGCCVGRNEYSKGYKWKYEDRIS